MADHTIATALKAIDDIQARLDNLLDILNRSEKQNARLSTELREAHREIEQLRGHAAENAWRHAGGPR